MDVDILYKPTYALAVLKLAGGEEVRAESGAMVSMSAGVQIETKATGGVLKSLARKMLTSESFWQNTFVAPAEGGHITVAPTLPGDIAICELQGNAIMLQSGDYVASEMSVQVDTQWGGAKTFFGGEGLFMLRCSGQGKLVLSSYGAIHEFELAAGQRYTIDTGHLVSFTEGMQFNIRKVGGLKSTFLSGEGIVVDLTGPGKVQMQTRSWNAFMSFLTPQLPSNRSGG